MIELLTSIILAASSPADQQAPDCSYDLEAMLALDWRAFDQDMNGGWRPLSYAGCDLEAAELIRRWRYEKREHISVLYWHEGQLRANIGQTQEAVSAGGLFGNVRVVGKVRRTGRGSPLERYCP